MALVQEIKIGDNRLATHISDQDQDTLLEVSFPTVPCLITHFSFLVRDSEQANKIFKLSSIEAKRNEEDDYTSLHDYEIPNLDPNIEFQQKGTVVMVPALGVSHSIRITFACHNDPEDCDAEVAAISKRSHWAIQAFQDCYSAVAIVGFSLNVSPTASHVVTLLNIASILRKEPEGSDADYLAGLALMNARRFVQASELIRRAESRFVGPLDMPTKTPRNFSTPHARSPSATNNKKLLRAAKLELLVAEGFNQHGQILDKLIAYEHATELYLGGTELDAVSLDSDIYSSLQRLQPHLGRLLLKNLHDKLEPLRMACVRGLEFLMENLGCSLGTQLIQTLKITIKSYPLAAQAFSSDSFNNSLMSAISISDIMHKEEPPSAGLIDSYNRLLETCLSTLSSASPQLLHSIFNEVLSHYLLISELPKDLKIYLLKFTEKVTTICEADLDYSSSLLTGILNMRSCEEINEHATRVWELVKTKVLPHYTASRLESLVNWIVDVLKGDSCEEHISSVLDLVILLGKREENQNSLIKPRQRPQLNQLMNPLLQWLDYSASNQERLVLFQQVWGCIVGISMSMPEINLVKIMMPLLQKVNEYCKMATLPLPMLKFLNVVLSDLKPDSAFYEFLLDFLPNFCQSIPSNVHDEVFQVLNQILSFIGGCLSEHHLEALIEGVLDQYTVKSQSQKQTRTYLTNLIVSQQMYLEFVLDYCFLLNQDNNFDHFKFDRQKIILEHDHFLEKLSFAIEVLSLLESPHSEIVIGHMEQIGNVCQKLLTSKDSHVRIRSLEVLRLLGEITLISEEDDTLCVSKLIAATVKPYLETGEDAKVVFYSLQLVDMIFKNLLPPTIDEERYQEARMLEALKLWNGVQNQIYSPWSNNRAISFSILCSWVQIDINQLRAPLQSKLKLSLLPLLLSLLSSKESESRAGALNIMGSFCGLNLPDNATDINTSAFKKHSDQVPVAIWEQVFHLQDDWDPMIRDAACVLIQLSAPKEEVRRCYQVQKEELSLRTLNIANLEIEEGSESPADENIFWAENYSSQELIQLVSLFKTDTKNPSQLWNEPREREGGLEFGKTEESKPEDEEETLEALGVIDIEDELLEGCDDEANNFPVIKNNYAKRKPQQKQVNQTTEDQTWSRPLRPHNSSLRPCTPPAKTQHDLPRAIRPQSRHAMRDPIIIEDSSTKPQESTSKQMPQPPPDIKDQKKEIPEFDIEEDIDIADLEEDKEEGHFRRNSLEDLEDLLNPEPELKLTPDFDIRSDNKSPQNSRKKIEEELANRLKNSVSQPTTLSKIYLQKPDLTIFKKKSRSLNNSLVKGRRGSSGKSNKKPKA